MSTNKPAYRLYQIEDRGEGNKFWREVGVAWENKDGSLNLDFAVIPLIGTHTVQARKYEDKKADDNGTEAPAGKRAKK